MRDRKKSCLKVKVISMIQKFCWVVCFPYYKKAFNFFLFILLFLNSWLLAIVNYSYYANCFTYTSVTHEHLVHLFFFLLVMVPLEVIQWSTAHINIVYAQTNFNCSTLLMYHLYIPLCVQTDIIQQEPW